MPITATTINLSDPFSTFVNKSNALVTDAGNLDSSIGNLGSLNTIDTSSLVAAINEISSLQSDPGGTTTFDSASRSFSITAGSITSSLFENNVTLNIKDASGSTLKTLHSPGS